MRELPMVAPAPSLDLGRGFCTISASFPPHPTGAALHVSVLGHSWSPWVTRMVGIAVPARRLGVRHLCLPGSFAVGFLDLVKSGKGLVKVW